MVKPKGLYVKMEKREWSGKVSSLRELVQLCPKGEAPKSSSWNILIEVKSQDAL